MRKILRRIFLLFYKRYALSRISKDEIRSYNGFLIHIPSGVFHPLLFFSTKFLANEISQLYLNDKTFLDIGCGSGILGMIAASKGAMVTCIDISQKAIETTRKNFAINNLDAEILISDLFDNLNQRHFDFIVINPPYYKKDPENCAEMAWFAGKDFEYFRKLFAQLPRYINERSIVKMVLSEDVDINGISDIALGNGMRLMLEKSTVVFFETNYVFRIVFK